MNNLEQLHLDTFKACKSETYYPEYEEYFSEEMAASKSAQITENIAIEFAEWLTDEKSPYAVMYGGTPERWATDNEDFTTKQLFDIFLNKKQ